MNKPELPDHLQPLPKRPAVAPDTEQTEPETRPHTPEKTNAND
jgi:hypothetical protein